MDELQDSINGDEQIERPRQLSELKRRTIRGGAAVLAAQAVAFLLHIVTTAILARLLTPADFGLVAMVTAVTGFAFRFKDAGLSMATIQRSGITTQQVSTLFWINVGLSGLLALGTASVAPVLARVYREPRLVAITLAVAVTIVFAGLGVQHTALLRRQMRLGVLAVTQILSSVVGALVGVGSALLGAGYWALVAMAAANLLTNACVVWVASGWVPDRPDRRSKVASLLRFGGHLSAFNFLNYFSVNADKILIGWALGARPLGLYSKAYGLLMLPLQQVNAPLGSVAVPALSRLQDEPEGFRDFFRRALELVAVCGKPMSIFLVVAAEETVLTVLGRQWIQVVPVFRALGLLMFMATTNAAVGWVYVSLGRPDRQVRWALIASPARVLAVVLGLHWGVIGVGLALCVVRATLYVPGLRYAFAGSPVTVSDFFLAIWRPAISSVIAGGILHAGHGPLRSIAGAHPLIFVTMEAVIYFAFYMFILSVLPGGRAFVRRSLHLMGRYFLPGGLAATDPAVANEEI